jgi:hypothetical protein
MSATTTDKPRPVIRSKKLDRMAAEDEQLGRGSAGDRLFFERNPDRNYRARLATSYEVAALEMIPEASGCAVRRTVSMDARAPDRPRLPDAAVRVRAAADRALRQYR